MRYFLPEGSEEVTSIGKLASQWLQSKEVGKAILKLQGKAWQEMTGEERIRFSVEKVYNEMAYFLYSHNYSELQGNDRQKADKCREVLEQKMAGTAGLLGPVEQFWKDVMDGKVRLVGSANPAPLPLSMGLTS